MNKQYTDTQRMDWLDKSCDLVDIQEGSVIVFSIEGDTFSADNLREAIDAAMADEEKEEGEG